MFLQRRYVMVVEAIALYCWDWYQCSVGTATFRLLLSDILIYSIRKDVKSRMWTMSRVHAIEKHSSIQKTKIWPKRG